MSDSFLIISAVVVAVIAAVTCRLSPRVGLILSPIFSVICGLCVGSIPPVPAPPRAFWERPQIDFFSYSNIAWVVGIGDQLLCLLVLVMVPERPSSAWPRAAAKWGLICFGSLVGAAMAAGLLGPLGLLLAMVVFALIVRYALISRDAWSTHLFTTLGAALRQSLPLTTVLDAEAWTIGGKHRKILHRVCERLTEGLLLSEAIQRGYPQCPGFALAQVAAAERINQVPQAVANIERQLRQRGRESRLVRPVNAVYPFLVAFILCTTLAAVAAFIFPNYDEIFSDMGARMPALSRWVFADLAPNVHFLIPVLFVFAAVWLYVLFRPRDPRRPKFLSRIGDRIKWHTPGYGWFERNSALLQTVSFLRIALCADTRVDLAIERAADLDMNACYRRKLEGWLERVQRGEKISDAARDSGVGAGLQWAFDQEVNPGQTLAVLEMLEGSCRSAYGFKANLVRCIFWPTALLCMAVAVGCVAVAMFLPLVAIIRQTMGEVLP